MSYGKIVEQSKSLEDELGELAALTQAVVDNWDTDLASACDRLCEHSES